MKMTNYYNQNAQTFYDGTVNVDMSSLYALFTPMLPAGGSILDAGCGSGRDTQYFLEQDFDVTAFDASAELAKLASEHTLHEIHNETFLSFSAPPESFDGIWACASLLHVQFSQLRDIYSHLAAQLKQNGIFYCSFKYGCDEIERDGRRFTNLNEVLLAELLEGSQLSIQRTWITEDLRPGRASEMWLNALLVKA